ncbi:MAG: hypothetical protein ACLPR9_04520 [Acidimicrobiales bacterium]
MVFAHTDEKVPDPAEAEDVAARRTIADAGDVPCLVLDDMLAVGERDDE